MYKYRAKLIKIIDGDTIDAEIDLGFNVKIKKRIRFLGINAPEIRTKDLDEKRAGLAVKSRLESIFDDSEGVFKLKSHGIDKYGRVLGEIYIENNNINSLLLKEGLVSEYWGLYVD